MTRSSTPPPHLGAVDRRLTGTTEFSNLPRKYKISITGCRVQCTVHEVMDIGPAPHFARRLGAFVPPEQVVDVGAGITGLFRDYGYRRDRHRARLKFLAADWAPARFRQVLEQKYLRRWRTKPDTDARSWRLSGSGRLWVFAAGRVMDARWRGCPDTEAVGRPTRAAFRRYGTHM